MKKFRKTKFTLIILFLLLLSIFTWSPWNRKGFNVHNIKVSELSDLSLQEREYLNNFFHFVMTISGFGYTLFGDKPMSIDGINRNDPRLSIEGFDYMARWNVLDKYRFQDGWDVWQKYFDRFELKGYTLKICPPYEDGYEEICFINHKAFLETVRTHHQDFKNVLGKDMSPEEILENFIHDSDFYDTVTYHEGLFGTLLGYGRNNAWEFLRRKSLSSLKESKLEGFNKEWFAVLHHVMYPMFVALPNTEETKLLHTKYAQQRKLIYKAFADGDFTTPTIQKITGR